MIYAYGPNTDQIFTAIEPILHNATVQPMRAYLLYGDESDPGYREQTIDLNDSAVGRAW